MDNRGLLWVGCSGSASLVSQLSGIASRVTGAGWIP